MKVRHGAVRARLGARARVRPWGDHRGAVQLVLTDQGTVPDPDELAGWLDELCAPHRELDLIRTGALFPAAAVRFAEAGFYVVDTLALLERSLSSDDAGSMAAEDRSRTAGLPARRHDDAASIDRHAFGAPWSNDGEELAEIRSATPRHVARGRYVGRVGHRRLVAFAITGAASGQGYLQRLAVDPAFQHQGHGRALTLDALRWMQRRRLRAALVNTSVDNAPALALYHSVGFTPRREQLQVMQIDVHSRR